MQKVLESIPELRQKSGNVSKHVTLTCELSKLVEERDLMEISKIEQELACKESKNEQFKVAPEPPILRLILNLDGQRCSE